MEIGGQLLQQQHQEQRLLSSADDVQIPLGQEVAVIVILSLLVLGGILFTIFGLLLKAEAFNRFGPGSFHESLLFADKEWDIHRTIFQLDDVT